MSSNKLASVALLATTAVLACSSDDSVYFGGSDAGPEGAAARAGFGGGTGASGGIGGSGTGGGASTGGTGTAGTGAGGDGTGGNGAGGAGAGGLGTGGSGGVGTGGVGGTGGSTACSGSVAPAVSVPLDLHVMLDKSGSMVVETQSGPTIWEAVEQAMTAFVNSPSSAGVGVGLQYFPLNKPGVPDSCTSDAECGAGGPCLLESCFGSGTTSLVPCATNSDCGLGETCEALGQCSNDTKIFCMPVGSSGCTSGGTCDPRTSSFCFNATSCTVSDYAAPAVAIAPLPGNAQALVDSLALQAPNGNTPTGPALQGAIDYASAHATGHPSHEVVSVFITDGQPTECAPTDFTQLAQLAAVGYLGAPSVRSFVIGLLSQATPPDVQPGLGEIALAGGTNTAILVDVEANVTQQLLDALDAIRGASSCLLQLPGGTVDFMRLNVQLDGTTLYYVGSENRCDPVQGGWRYDDAASPTRIVLCPSSCSQFAGPTSQARIVSGCARLDAP